MSRSIVLLAAFAAWAGASVAWAADDALVPDLRCLVVATALAQDANPQMKAAGTTAGFYYLGKLDGRTPSTDLEAGLKQEMARVSPADVQAEAVRCGQQLQVRGKAIVEISASSDSEAP